MQIRKTDLLLENANLRAENKDIKAENKELRNDNEELRLTINKITRLVQLAEEGKENYVIMVHEIEKELGIRQNNLVQ